MAKLKGWGLTWYKFGDILVEFGSDKEGSWKISCVIFHTPYWPPTCRAIAHLLSQHFCTDVRTRCKKGCGIYVTELSFSTVLLGATGGLKSLFWHNSDKYLTAWLFLRQVLGYSQKQLTKPSVLFISSHTVFASRVVKFHRDFVSHNVFFVPFPRASMEEKLQAMNTLLPTCHYQIICWNF